jgi:hypothetical protein
MKIIRINAVWCSACLVMKKVYKKIQLTEPSLVWEDFDYDLDHDRLVQWQLGTTLPVMIFIDEAGQELGRLIGEKSYDQVMVVINQYKGK